MRDGRRDYARLYVDRRLAHDVPSHANMIHGNNAMGAITRFNGNVNSSR